MFGATYKSLADPDTVLSLKMTKSDKVELSECPIVAPFIRTELF